jgi:hypothetical protein
MNQLDEHTLVIFDIDNTLLYATDPFFRIKNAWQRFLLWTYYAFKTKDFLLTNSWWYFNTAFFHAHFDLVSKESVHIIKALQKQNVKVISLTKCPTGTHKSKHNPIKYIENWRINQLLNFDIDFNKAFPNIKTTQFTNLSKNVPPMYKKGILFCNVHTPKGPLLLAFLKLIKQKTGWQPNKVIIVDDNYNNIKSIQKSISKHKIPCTALHYTAKDSFLIDVVMKVVFLQMKMLIEKERFVPYAKAEKIIFSNPDKNFHANQFLLTCH